MDTARPHARTSALALLVAALFIAVALAALLAAPRTALAKSYEMTNVDITANVLANGDVDVVEYRTFDFDGSFSSVYWTLPLANSQGVDVWGTGEYDEDSETFLLYAGRPQGAREGSSNLLETTSLEDAGAQDWTASLEAQTEAAPSGAFELASDGENLEARLRFSKEDVTVTFWIAYTVEGGAKAWADTGDVTWQAVGPGWGEASQNVSVTLQLPVPDGTSVALGNNVRAWADGPLDGVIGLNDDGSLSFTCPYVASGQYLSVMVAFPVAWLTEETPSSEGHLDAMMAMGQQIADSANAERSRARLVMVAAGAASVVIAGGVIALLLVKFFKYGKEHKATFDDKYWRDMPSDDHPAVIGALWRWGESKDEDLTASLMRLTQMGALKMERVRTTQAGLLGRTKVKDDYRLTEVPGFDRTRLDAIDAAALNLVLGLMDEGADDEPGETAGSAGAGGVSETARKTARTTLFSELAANAKAHPYRFRNRHDAWTAAVQDAVNDREAYEAGGELWCGRARGIGGVLLFVAVIALVGADNVGLTPCVALGVAGAFSLVIAPKMRRRSAEANEIAAKTKALRNWLCDFTNLKEAVPGDVVLWGKMLVLAVVLGVSDRVVEQLKLVAPQMLESPDLMPYYLWYMPYNGLTPASAFGTAASEAHSLSNAEIARTENSSADGSGGGFGGGGFGSSFGGSSFGGGGGGAN